MDKSIRSDIAGAVFGVVIVGTVGAVNELLGYLDDNYTITRKESGGV